MKVLMFGWEFPPKIYGGLAVASYGITKGLSLQGDMETIFCMPKPSGEEEKFLKIIGMNQVPIVWRDVNYDYLKSRLLEMTPEEYYSFRDHIYADFSYMHVNDLGCMEFAGGYPGNLHEEINNFSIIAGVVARQQEFDIIHAHDWLTYPAGVHAKMVSGKPLCIHVHATDFDRSRGKVNPTVYSIEKNVSCAYQSLLVALLLTSIIRTPGRYLPCIMLFIHCRRNCWIFHVPITQKKRWSLSLDVLRCRKDRNIL